MKIALIGSAPSSVALAPFDDESWQIWACSPGAWPHLRRVDAFFEIHRWRPGEDGFSPDYITWMAGLTCPVYTIEHREDIPASVAYPTDQILSKYPGLARSFFTSSLAWMLALAIEQDGIEEIGLWGVDMAAHDEYAHQKPGCHYFIEQAQNRGIKVTVPPQSDLLRPIPMYGIGEAHPMRIKLAVRKQELEHRLNEIMAKAGALDKQFQEATREQFFVQGALDDLQYMLNTWTE